MGMGMKSIKDQTYYEILEISPTATAKEIQRAYEHAKETFHADSMAVYSLFSEKEMKINTKTLEWIEEEAFEKLPALVYLKGFLKSYAQSLGLDPSKVIEEYLRFKEESKKK